LLELLKKRHLLYSIIFFWSVIIDYLINDIFWHINIEMGKVKDLTSRTRHV